jgi:MoaA/NifB/PqqE/SkfB family radical SAM enzyme
MNLSILYRGPLSSCNYACAYCPFAKRTETAAELRHDRECLARFVAWVRGRDRDAIGVLFTPWGEALVRPWYQDALGQLTRMPHVQKAAIQTNLSCKLDWIDDCDRTRLALWCTFHPSETTRERFLAKCHELIARGVRFSAGVVGMKEHLAEIDALRRALPESVYLWVNAYKRDPDYYTPAMIADLAGIDPLFPINNQHHESRGESCRAGSSVISVDGDGTVRRCHFVRELIGNVYAPDFEECLMERPCPNDTCGCHIGYVHLDRLRLYDVFGDGVLERVPDNLRGDRELSKLRREAVPLEAAPVEAVPVEAEA